MRLLIVDDDKFTCRGIQLRIQNMNLKPIQEIHMAFSGEEALAFARENPVDILLTDIKMVNMNGLELIRRVKELHPHVCSLILTAYASFPYAQQAIELGVIGFLLKLRQGGTGGHVAKGNRPAGSLRRADGNAAAAFAHPVGADVCAAASERENRYGSGGQ